MAEAVKALQQTSMDGAVEEIDLYGTGDHALSVGSTDSDAEVLGLSRNASKTEIKKAYHKAALASHPDKVAEEDREAADVRFKTVGQAYEILYDEEKREVYDTHGMSAFESGSNGIPGGVNVNDLFQQFFGMGGGMPPGFGGGRPKQPRKGANVDKPLKVTLEQLYRGKTTKFRSKKNVICTLCKGKGAKESAKSKSCGQCHGQGKFAVVLKLLAGADVQLSGFKQTFRNVGHGLLAQEDVVCSKCDGQGSSFKDSDKCKKCKGAKTNEEGKLLEIYIRPGSKDKDTIVFTEEADQSPDQTPGDIVFHLEQMEHAIFTRTDEHLTARIEITLAEALCGFSRVVIQHLDGRGIHLNQPRGRVTKPDQIFKIVGEGMPIKQQEAKGNLYLVVDIKFPDYDESMMSALGKILPHPEKPINADTVDEVDFEEIDDMEEELTTDEGHGWVDADEDEDDEAGGHAQCAQQ
ncbi:hypothetical protein MMC13_008083 [Lambiella insularis]|nr:hypothetical protein [Lambiella insularis]